MADLAEVEKRSSLRARQPDPILSAISIPLKDQEWLSQLSNHPDQQFVAYLAKGMSEGFHIGFDHSWKLCSAKKSASEHPEIVREYLCEESAGRKGSWSFSARGNFRFAHRLVWGHPKTASDREVASDC